MTDEVNGISERAWDEARTFVAEARRDGQPVTPLSANDYALGWDDGYEAARAVRGTINYILTMARADAETDEERDMVDHLAERINAAFEAASSTPMESK